MLGLALRLTPPPQTHVTRLAASPHVFDSWTGRDAGTLSFLPNFHVIGFTNNFLFNLYAGGLPSRPRLPPHPTPTSQATQEPSV